MSTFHLEIPSPLAPPVARQRLGALLTQQARRYGLTVSWSGLQANFSRIGVKGTARIEPDQIVVDGTLNPLLSGLQGRIEQGIRQQISSALAGDTPDARAPAAAAPRPSVQEQLDELAAVANNHAEALQRVHRSILGMSITVGVFGLIALVASLARGRRGA